MLRKFFISIIKSLIALALFAIIFSGADSSGINQSVNNVFRGIYDYASPDAQKQVVSSLEGYCGSLSHGEDAVTLQQLCNDKTMLESMKENCRSFSSLKQNGVGAGNEKNLMEACGQIESKDFEKICNELNNKRTLAPNLDGLKGVCISHDNKSLSDKEFFAKFVENSFDGSQISSLGALQKYNDAMAFLNSNNQIYYISLIVLVIILYLLIFDVKNFFITLTGIMFGIGVLILLPYYLILLYDALYGIDTSWILNSLFSGGLSFGYKSLIGIMLIAYLQIYNPAAITIGFAMLGIGLIGKTYGFLSKSKKEKSTSR